MSLKAIILAAGKGTRMKSESVKVAHNVAGKPIINYVIDAVKAVGVDEIVIIVGHQAELVKKITGQPKVQYALQEEQLGTGHAAMQAEKVLNIDEKSDVIVLAGDCPLISPETLKNLIAVHKESIAAGSILTTKMKDPDGYGRILRGQMGNVLGIREAKDCTEEELKIKEINSGIYIFNTKLLFESLKKIGTNNQQHEYYLTDVIEILRADEHSISAFCTNDSNEVIGINTRMDQAQTNSIIYARNTQNLMSEGVTIIDPGSTFIDSTVKIGHDTIIYPFTMITGNSEIGPHCKIGPNVYIEHGQIAESTCLPPFSSIGQVKC